MVECPLCKSAVQTLKTNSHILPAWMMREIKERGRMVKIASDDLKERFQTDPKADIVCEACELKFKEVDTFAALFFRDKKFFKDTQLLEGKSESMLCEVHDHRVKPVFQGFIMSLFLRTHLFCIVQRSTPILGPHFDEMGRQFLTENLDLDRFPMVAVYFESLKGTLFLPYRNRMGGRICLEVTILGYRIWLFTDSQSPSPEFLSFSNTDDFVIPINEDRNVRIFRDLRTHVLKLKQKSRIQGP